MKHVNLLLGIGSLVVGVAVAYGALAAKVSAQETKIATLEDLPELVSALNAKVDNLEDMSKEMRGDIKTLLKEKNSMPPPRP